MKLDNNGIDLESVSMNDLRGATMVALEARYRALLETQTILQILVSKNIVTSEEVSDMRTKVDNNSLSVKKAKSDFENMSNSFDADKFENDRAADQFSKLFYKFLQDPNSVSEEEKEIIKKSFGDKKF